MTPLEWKDQKEQEKRERKRVRKQAWVDRRMAEYASQMQAELDAEERAAEEKEKETAKSRRRQRREAEEEAKEKEREREARRRRIRRRYPTVEAVESEYQEVSSGEEMPLYFQEPKQLLDIFTSLEESNLFLIQNSQETEQALEELTQKFNEMKTTGGAKTSKMKHSIALLERQIADERAKCEELRQTTSQKRGSSEQEELLKELGVGVQEVHRACIHEAERDSDTLQMLQDVEKQLEKFLTYLDECESEEGGMAQLVEELERKKEYERRANVRRQRKEQTDRKIEERLKASLQRSQAPVHKKVGKQIMFRSAHLFQARRVVQEDDGFEEAVREHDVFGIWLNKEGVPKAEQPARQS